MSATELDFQDVEEPEADSDQPLLEDLFALDDDESAESVIIGIPGPEVWFSVAVLTVPDLTRYPLPAEFGGVEEVKVDLGNLAAMAGGETKALIQPSLPAEQLELIYQDEINRDKPRGIVLKAIAVEQERRGGGFEAWVKTHAANPLTCRIAALAYSCGDNEPIVFAPVDLATEGDPVFTERDALKQMFGDWLRFCAETGYSFLAAWDLSQAMRVITARSIFNGLLQDGHSYHPMQPIAAPASMWLPLSQEAGGLMRTAEAFGIHAAEINDVATPMQVYLEHRQRAGSTLLQDWVSGQLTLERDILTVTQSLWDR